MRSLDCVLEALQCYRAWRPAPEWGGGGVYGLLYHRGSLVMTLAFDAETIVASSSCSIDRYDYSLVGSPPRSGGDTYNSVVAVDNTVYFGGWVHAPPDYRGGRLFFTNKYSHVHYYDMDNYEFGLLWSESIHDERLWAGEVTDLDYNPVTGDLLLARGDGHRNIGAYILTRGNGGWRAERLEAGTYLRLTLHDDKACYVEDVRWSTRGFKVTCFTLEDYRRDGGVAVEPEPVDGLGRVRYPRVGDVQSLHRSLYVAAKGLLAVVDPNPEGGGEWRVLRLLDMGCAFYAPFRSNMLPYLGGLLAAYNASTMATIVGTDEVPRDVQSASLRPPADTLLVYITPSSIRIVARLGLRVTSMTSMGGDILVAANTLPNLERYDATRTDWSVKTLAVLPSTIVTNTRPPPVTITLHGSQVGAGPFGGIPLEGYREARLLVKSSRQNKLTVVGYTPTGEVVDKESFGLNAGVNRIALDGYTPLLVSMKLEKHDPKALVVITMQ